MGPAPERLIALARAARESTGRSIAAVDTAMADIAKSNARIKTMQTKASRPAIRHGNDRKRVHPGGQRADHSRRFLWEGFSPNETTEAGPPPGPRLKSLP
jgi:hypothetical protein